MADVEHISDALVGARRAAKALTGFPGVLPETLADAYAVQARSRSIWNDDIAGWKVGGVPPAFQQKYGADRLTGPIYARNVRHAASGERSKIGVFPEGFMAVESEFVIRLGTTRAEDRMHIGIEIASSPIPAINDFGPAAVVCDFGNNNGLIVGPEITGWREFALSDLHAETIIDGVSIAKASAADSPGGPPAALAFWLAHAARYDLLPAPGTYISSGAVTGVHEAPIGSVSRADFGQFGSLDVELVAATPQA